MLVQASRKVNLAGKLLLDTDPRVQAAAVEALWSFDEMEATPLLLAASRARNHRVVGNAAIGLHRYHNPKAIKVIWTLARHSDPQSRIAAVWVMGETGDPRFLPFLEDLAVNSNGVPKPVILRALTRLRTRQEECARKGLVRIRVHRAVSEAAGRRIEFSLGPASLDTSRIHPLEFALTEGDQPVTEFELVTKPNPALVAVSFVVPRILSMVDPLRVAIEDGMKRCLPFKRNDDTWRLDRYAVEGRVARDWQEKWTPYDDVVPLAKQHRGFVSDTTLVQHAIVTSGPKERAGQRHARRHGPCR